MIKNGKKYDDEIEISMNGNTYKIPLSDYLDIEARQMGFDDYADLYKSATRIKGYEDISPMDLENYQKELKQKDLKELKDKLSEYNINIKSFNSYYVKNGISIYCGELEDGRYFINDLNENIYLTNNNFNNYFNSQTKEIDFSKMATEDEPNDELSKLFIDYLLIAKSDFKPIENDNIVYVQSTDNTSNVDYGNDNTSYISNKTLSSYHKEFIEYCKGKVKDLPLSNFLLGKKYPTLMLCSINGQDNNAIVFVKGHENELCWRDSYKGTLNFIQNSAPDIYAVDMKFDAIDTKYYESLNKYWDDLRLDEIMEINNNRLNVIDSYNDKEM